ncbi:MAG: SRPBCC family protein [Acidimicrobiia bacterium]
MNGSVTVHMAASPSDVWELVSDVTRIGEFSPETFEAEWIDGATGPELGAKFRGHVRRNGWWPPYWTTCIVVACEPNREFAFGVGGSDRILNRWGYVLEASDGGTDVTESFALTPTLPLRLYWAIAGWMRSRTNHDGMTETLKRIKAVVE